MLNRRAKVDGNRDKFKGRSLCIFGIRSTGVSRMFAFEEYTMDRTIVEPL